MEVDLESCLRDQRDVVNNSIRFCGGDFDLRNPCLQEESELRKKNSDSVFAVGDNLDQQAKESDSLDFTGIRQALQYYYHDYSVIQSIFYSVIQ